MTQHTPPAASCRIYTFKEGLFAAVGHDLVLSVGRFELTLEAGAVRATFELGSIRTLCARKNRVDAPGVLSESDIGQIDHKIRTAVLDVARFPKAVFTSTALDREDDDEWEVSGQLALHGVTRSVRAQVKKVGATRVAKVAIHQPDWGIKPYSALMGTLRVKPMVEVEVTIPETAG